MNHPIIQAKYRGNPQVAADHLRVAKRVLDGARETAIDLIKSKRQALAQRLIRIHDQVRARAWKCGIREATKSLEAEHLRVQSLYVETVRASQNDCLEVALAVAREVIADEIKIKPSALAMRISTALESLVDMNGITVVVHSSMKESIEALLKSEFPNVPMKVAADELVKPGNAVLQSISGTIELDWEAHFEVLSSTLRTRLGAALNESEEIAA